MLSATAFRLQAGSHNVWRTFVGACLQAKVFRTELHQAEVSDVESRRVCDSGKRQVKQLPCPGAELIDSSA